MNKEMVNAYIESKKNAWSPVSLKNERSKLHKALLLIQQGPEALYVQGIQLYSPYSLKQLFIRAGEFYRFCNPDSANPFKLYMKNNAQLFKNVYDKEELDVSYEEARVRIEGLEGELKELALFLITTGLRAEEALKYDGSGFVIGKGKKKRKVFSTQPYPKGHQVTYSMLHKGLAKVNLKPHTLRKLYATKLADNGLQAVDLMKIMGWNSMETASLYLQAKNDLTLTKQLEVLFG
jgi:integrase